MFFPPPGTAANEQLQKLSGWGKSTLALDQLQELLTDHKIPAESLRQDGQPYLLVSGKVLVWTGYTAEVFYWGTEPGRSAESAPSPNMLDIARRIAAQVSPASRPIKGEGRDVVTTA
ncbi:hypothetical protein AB0D67_32650 [Streptosporangium sp. NPDC048047]|uniref:hypothetical protein n=1 Tax=Streptosporangium sp. NPDC048047 TaxID=3155748 RepID=UPI0034403EF5